MRSGASRSSARSQAGIPVSDPDWDNHCADLAAERYRKVKGKSLWRELGRKVRSPKDAAAVYRKLGVENFKDAVSKVLGPPIDPKLVMRGDIAMVDNALGIVRGDLIECFDRMQPIHRAECAWPLRS